MGHHQQLTMNYWPLHHFLCDKRSIKNMLNKTWIGDSETIDHLIPELKTRNSRTL